MNAPLPRRVLFAAAALLVCLPALPRVFAADRASLQTGLDRELRAMVERGDVPGVVVAAADRRGVVYQGAFGVAEKEAGRAMAPDSIFRIASMTKAVTSVALMQLFEAKKIALDDPASKYLPELADVQVFESFNPATGEYKLRPPASPITVRHLLTHTSGLGYGFTSETLAKFKPRAGEKYAAGPLLFDPGTDWAYGTNTDMIGKIVETLSGKTLEAYFQEKILQPLGMKDTSYNVPEEKLARLVNNFQRGAGGVLAERPRQAPKQQTRFNGGGGLVATAGDYLRFLRMLLNGGELEGVRILKPETVALMARNHIGNVGVRVMKTTSPATSRDFTFIDDGQDKWGLGFLITSRPTPGKRAAGSLSWGGINNTYFWIDPERGVAGVILMQFLPFSDPKALGVYDAFERGVYRMVE